MAALSHQGLSRSKFELSKGNGVSQDIWEKNYSPFAASTRKSMRSSRAMWQKCQVNRCSYRKSRIVTSLTASANESNAGSKFFSACWPIVNSTLEKNKSNSVGKSSKSTLNLEVFPVVVNRWKGWKGTRRLNRVSQPEVNSKKPHHRPWSYRRRDKLVTCKVRRQNFKWKQCPSAPHNTTSFIMDYHKDEMPSHEAELSGLLSGEILSIYYDSWYDSDSFGEEKSGEDNDDIQQPRRTWEDYLLQDELVPVITR